MTEDQAWWLIFQNWIIIAFLVGFVIYNIALPPSFFKDRVTRQLDETRGDLQVIIQLLREIEWYTKSK